MSGTALCRLVRGLWAHGAHCATKLGRGLCGLCSSCTGSFPFSPHRHIMGQLCWGGACPAACLILEGQLWALWVGMPRGSQKHLHPLNQGLQGHGEELAGGPCQH